MKPSQVICVLCSILLITQFSLLVSLKATKLRTAKTVTSFIEKELYEVKGVGLTPTLNVSDNEYFHENEEISPVIVKKAPAPEKFIKPRIVNYIQKQEKDITNKNQENRVENQVSNEKKEKLRTEKLISETVSSLPSSVVSSGKDIKKENQDLNMTFRKATKEVRGVFSKNKIFHHDLSDYATNDIKAYNYNPLFENAHRNMMEKPQYVRSLRRDNPVKKADIPKTYLPVQLVKELSPAAKADYFIKALYKDHEYVDILDKGYESPVISRSITGAKPTPVLRASKVDYLWSHPVGEKDRDLWANVEYNRFGNNITNKYTPPPPAKFYIDSLGGKRVDAPPNTGLEITSSVPSFNIVH